jgi:hypothetical protein
VTSRPALTGRPALTSAALLGGVLLATLLSGCAGGSPATSSTPNSPATGVAGQVESGSDGTGTSTAAKSDAATNTGPAAGSVDQKTAEQIQTTVNDAQSLLDGLDQDFAGDAADTSN